MSALEQLIANMTVARFAELANMDVGTVAELVLGKGGSVQAAPKAAPKARGGRKVRKGGPAQEVSAAPETDQAEHNTRTRAGREALDNAILEYLKASKEPVRALAIRDAIGGTAAQIRTRLNYLIEKKKVTYTGRASGTKYKAK